jgi:hypothetical protein
MSTKEELFAAAREAIREEDAAKWREYNARVRPDRRVPDFSEGCLLTELAKRCDLRTREVHDSRDAGSVERLRKELMETLSEEKLRWLLRR